MSTSWDVTVNATDDAGDLREAPLVTVQDTVAGWHATVTVRDIDGRPAITSLALEMDETLGPVTQERLSRVPMRTLANVAAAHVAIFRRGLDDGRADIEHLIREEAGSERPTPEERAEATARVVERMRTDPGGVAARIAELRKSTAPPPVPQKRRTPTPAEFAEVWRGLQERQNVDPGTGMLIGRREWLAAHYGVSLKTIDRWTRAARDGGHIPAATTGRTRYKD